MKLTREWEALGNADLQEQRSGGACVGGREWKRGAVTATRECPGSAGRVSPKCPFLATPVLVGRCPETPEAHWVQSGLAHDRTRPPPKSEGPSPHPCRSSCRFWGQPSVFYGTATSHAPECGHRVTRQPSFLGFLPLSHPSGPGDTGSRLCGRRGPSAPGPHCHCGSRTCQHRHICVPGVPRASSWAHSGLA